MAQARHPLRIAVSLAGFVLLGCIVIGFERNVWLAYIIFLVFYGGLIVVFGYIIALAPNHKSKIMVSSRGLIVCLVFCLWMAYWCPMGIPKGEMTRVIRVSGVSNA